MIKIKETIKKLKTLNIMKRNLFIAAMSLLVMAGCTEGSDELDKIQPQGQDNTVKFTAYVGLQTKTATPLENFAGGTSFKVLTSKNAGGSLTSFTTDVNAEVTKMDGTWSLPQGTTLYWPKKTDDAIDFLAYYPSTLSGSATDAKLTLGKYDIKTETNELLYDVQKGQKKASNNGTVSFTFKHALAKIKFNVQTKEGTTEEITVTKVEFKGIPCAGICTINNIYSSPLASWDNLEGTIDYTGATEQALGTEFKVFPYLTDQLVIPQSSGTEYSVDISYKYGTITDKATIKITPTWVAGKAYTYTLQIGLDAVRFEVEENLNGWDNQPNQDYPKL